MLKNNQKKKQKWKLLKIERGWKKSNAPKNKEINKKVKLKLKVAENSINEGNMKLQKGLRESKLFKKGIQEAQPSALSLLVFRWAGENTDLPSNSNISKTETVNIAFTGTFLKNI